MKAGHAAGTTRIVASLQPATSRARARCARDGGTAPEAFRRYAHAAEDFRGLADVGGVEEAEARAEALGRLPRGPDGARRTREEPRRARRATLRASRHASSATRSPQPEPPLSGRRSRRELGIPALRKKAASGLARGASLGRAHPREPARADVLLSARADARTAGPDAGARLLLAVAAEIDPDNPLVYYNLACLRGAFGRRVASDQGSRGRRREGIHALRAHRRGHRLRLRSAATRPSRNGSRRRAAGGRAPSRLSALRAGHPDQPPHARALPKPPDERRDEHPRQGRRGGVEHRGARPREQRQRVAKRLEERRSRTVPQKRRRLEELDRDRRQSSPAARGNGARPRALGLLDQTRELALRLDEVRELPVRVRRICASRACASRLTDRRVSRSAYARPTSCVSTEADSTWPRDLQLPKGGVEGGAPRPQA